MANPNEESDDNPQDDRVSGSSNCYVVEHRPTWRERIRYRLFPHRHCFAPEAPAAYKDCVSIRTVTVLSWADRLRIMLTGRVVTETRTVTEHEVGDSITNAVTYAGTKHVDASYPDVDSRKPEPKRNARRVVFEFDERSYESLEDIKRRTGCELTMVVVRNPETGEEREIALPSMPENAKGNRAAKERFEMSNDVDAARVEPVVVRRVPNAVMQTTPTNCFRACVATVLGLGIDDVPTACDGGTWDWDAFQDWLADRGMQAIEVGFGNGGTIYPVRKPVTCIVTGSSPRECTTGRHAVVGELLGLEGFRLLHDPHPSELWIDGEPTHAVFFVGV